MYFFTLSNVKICHPHMRYSVSHFVSLLHTHISLPLSIHSLFQSSSSCSYSLLVSPSLSLSLIKTYPYPHDLSQTYHATPPYTGCWSAAPRPSLQMEEVSTTHSRDRRHGIGWKHWTHLTGCHRRRECGILAGGKRGGRERERKRKKNARRVGIINLNSNGGNRTFSLPSPSPSLFKYLLWILNE